MPSRSDVQRRLVAFHDAPAVRVFDQARDAFVEARPGPGVQALVPRVGVEDLEVLGGFAGPVSAVGAFGDGSKEFWFIDLLRPVREVFG